jgi:hypothetical protein
MRWNVVIGGQLFSKSFLGYTTYKMGFVTREGMLPAIILVILPFAILYVLIKILPPWQNRTTIAPAEEQIEDLLRVRGSIRGPSSKGKARLNRHHSPLGVRRRKRRRYTPSIPAHTSTAQPTTSHSGKSGYTVASSTRSRNGPPTGSTPARVSNQVSASVSGHGGQGTNSITMA